MELYFKNVNKISNKKFSVKNVLRQLLFCLSLNILKYLPVSAWLF